MKHHVDWAITKVDDTYLLRIPVMVAIVKVFDHFPSEEEVMAALAMVNAQ